MPYHLATAHSSIIISHVDVFCKTMDNLGMNLYIVRHGETEGNLTGMVVGRSNDGLTARGIAQMESVREMLRGVRFEGIYVSPTVRTRQSLEILRPATNDFIVDARISERDLGELPPTAIEELWGTTDWNSMMEMRTSFGAETLLSGYRRVADFLMEISEKFGENDDVLIVTHSFVSRCIWMLMNGVTDAKLTHDFMHRNDEVKTYFLNKSAIKG